MALKPTMAELAEQAEAEAGLPLPTMITREEAQKLATDAAESAVARVLEALANKQAAEPATSQAGNEMLAFVQQLAKSIAEVGNQGTGKVVVDPSVMQSRENARVQMMTLIAEAWRDQVPPEYELSGKVHLNDQIIEPLWTDALKKTHRTKIVWYGPPNIAMSPVSGNDRAKGIYDSFCEWIGRAPGISANLRAVDQKGRLVSPGGNVFQDLEPIPREYGRSTLVIEEGAMPPREVPHNGLEIAGQGANSRGRSVEVPILGTIAPPARQMVA